MTVAVLLKPRYDGYKPRDTTMTAISGDLELGAEAVAALRQLWDQTVTSGGQASG